MFLASRETELYRRDEKHNHTLFTPKERERLIQVYNWANPFTVINANPVGQPYLPTPPSRSPERHADRPRQVPVVDEKTRPCSRFGVRKFLKNLLHAFLYIVIHTIFSVYIRIRQAYHAIIDRIFAVLYYHHRTPELIRKDVKGLKRLPEHLSVILKLEDGGKGGAELGALVDEVSEIAAWCACAGIPKLSVYEQTGKERQLPDHKDPSITIIGILKGYIPATHRAITRRLSSYFGYQVPATSLRAPHVPSIESSPSASSDTVSSDQYHLSILLISAEDGRDSLVDLTKTLTEMSQRSKISSNDISIDLVDAEMSESVMAEPDLLILFGPTIELSGYPPWPLRLTELFYVQDNHGVGYQVFLRALYSYASAQMRFGR
jgi:dehydrodolichyl diphosphate syntase complex subunit NUS1